MVWQCLETLWRWDFESLEIWINSPQLEGIGSAFQLKQVCSYMYLFFVSGNNNVGSQGGGVFFWQVEHALTRALRRALISLDNPGHQTAQTTCKWHLWMPWCLWYIFCTVSACMIVGTMILLPYRRRLSVRVNSSFTDQYRRRSPLTVCLLGQPDSQNVFICEHVVSSYWAFR